MRSDFEYGKRERGLVNKTTFQQQLTTPREQYYLSNRDLNHEEKRYVIKLMNNKYRENRLTRNCFAMSNILL